ncbi:hypothetical protein Lalb_Chr15g0087471 [Lupinus albus]|uniref:Uncharacterized protein n=1 Tax=Lupinus albus TaxID=3870 RepID=A0A6A4PAD5_LUPAL|nr:hypothetical protein Lalb_Chr15g0087471 [Lupinus albus]
MLLPVMMKESARTKQKSLQRGCSHSFQQTFLICSMRLMGSSIIMNLMQYVETKKSSHERLSEGKHEKDSSKSICERMEFIKRSKVEYFGQAQCSLGTDMQMFETTHSFSPIHASGMVSENPGDVSKRNKQSLSMDSHGLKEGEMVGRLKDARPGTHYVHCDSNPDEFLFIKLFEQKNSSEPTLESRKSFLSLVTSGFHNMENTNKRITDILFEETKRSHATTILPHPQQQKAINVDAGSQNKSTEMSDGLRSNESVATRGIDLDGIEITIMHLQMHLHLIHSKRWLIEDKVRVLQIKIIMTKIGENYFQMKMLLT